MHNPFVLLCTFFYFLKGVFKIINAIILGKDDRSVILKNLIEKVYNPNVSEKINVVAYVSGGVGDNSATLPKKFSISFETMVNWYHSGRIQKIIMCREDFFGQSPVIPVFFRTGIKPEDFLISQRIKWSIFEGNLENLLEPYFKASYLPYLEFHIADHCNLNCKACMDFAALVKEEKFPDFETWSQQFDLLKNFIEDIGVIRIMGGEPLLNPDVVKYMIKTRENYLLSDIYIVTNGIKLMSMPEEFFTACKDLKIEILISVYPPFEKAFPKVMDFLREKKISHLFTKSMDGFYMKYTLQPHNDPKGKFIHCMQARCNNFYDGKIAACFLPFMQRYFNEYFGTNLPEDGAIDLLEKNLTTEKLKRRLLQPIDRCRYCSDDKLVPWDHAKNPSVLEDWIRD